SSLLIPVQYDPHLSLHSFPTRRSSDLIADRQHRARAGQRQDGLQVPFLRPADEENVAAPRLFSVEEMQSRNRMAINLFAGNHLRSEEHTSELQSRENLVCRLLLEKKKR